ncbi:DUF4097 domain-containing protein [Gemmatimonadota bacterium]
MNKKMIKLVLLGVIVLATCGFKTLRAGQPYQDEYTEEFEFAPGGQFTLMNVTGTISIIGTDEDRISIKAVKVATKAESREQAEGMLNRVRIEVNKTEKSVKVTTKYPKREGSISFDDEKYSVPRSFMGKISKAWDILMEVVSGATELDFIGRGIPVKVNYEIKVPRRTSLEVNNVDGKIDISEIERNVEVQQVNGDLSLGRLEGDIEANVVNGSVWLKEINGSIEARCINGSIELEIGSKARVTGAELNLVNGDAVIIVEESAALDLELATFSGEVEVELPLTIKETHRSGKKITGELNGGGPRMEVIIINGDIRVRKK